MSDRHNILAQITLYWQEAGLPRRQIEEMRNELDQHLTEAERDGRSMLEVVGDRAKFAEEWAAAGSSRRVPTWQDVQSGKTKKQRQARQDNVLYGLAGTALVASAIVAGKGGTSMDNEMWRWVWTIFALVMGIGEIFSAGFFLLPFAVGATGAAILAWLDVHVIAQWLVFFGLSAFSFAYLRRFVNRQDEGDQPKVGANRWVGQPGMVLDTIDPNTGAGMVKVLNEEWRATSDGRIEIGARIVVTEVKGTRLVVERFE